MIQRTYFYRIQFKDRSSAGVVSTNSWLPSPHEAFLEVMRENADSGEFTIAEFTRV